MCVANKCPRCGSKDYQIDEVFGTYLQRLMVITCGRCRENIIPLVVSRESTRGAVEQLCFEAWNKAGEPAVLRYWLCCGSTDPIHDGSKCFEARTGHPDRVRYGTRQEHSIWSKTQNRKA